MCYARFPLNSRAWSDSIDIALVQLYINWGGMLHTSGRYAEAVTRADEGLIRIDEHLRIEPNDAAAREMCLKLHGNRGYALMGLEKTASRPWSGRESLSCPPSPYPRFTGPDWPSSCSEPVKMPALTEALLVKPDPSIGGEDRYDLGCVFARSAALVHNDSHLSQDQRGPRKESHHERHAWLKLAADGGLFKNPAMCEQAEKDPDLAALRPLEEFRRLIAASVVKS